MNPRWYQQEAHDAAIKWVKSCTDPCMIEAATGAGKSFIVTMLAQTLHVISGGKHIMCLAPNSKLVKQNREKFLTTGSPASVYSASGGGKCLKHPVVFGTPGTVKGAARRLGSEFCAVIVDECHGMTPTVLFIIDEMRKSNPNLRVIGLSATPFRTQTGYIYRMDERGKANPDSTCRDPFFMSRVYCIQARQLIEEGFLTQPVIGSIGAESYDTAGIEIQSNGKYSSVDIDRAFVGHGRKTAEAVADVVAQSRNRQGVMLFAATVQHAKEVMASLPPEISALVTGEQSAAECDRIYAGFAAKRIKYLVSVGKLTTGFDSPHVDVIALLRLSESVNLVQQIIGRGLRVDNLKTNCLILDYAQNIERHFPDGDLFAPEVKAAYASEGLGSMGATCPSCGTDNEFSARKNDEGYQVNDAGYFVDLDGNEIETDHGPMPAHHGRRCQGMSLVAGQHAQCSYRWTCKKCPHCEEDNDIAARYCKACKGEIIDPNEKLHIEFKALKRDPTRIQTDKVLSMVGRPVITQSGKERHRVDYVTEYRQFSIWYDPTAKTGQRHAEWFQLQEAGEVETVTYRKDPQTKFYRVYGYNRGQDEDTSGY